MRPAAWRYLFAHVFAIVTCTSAVLVACFGGLIALIPLAEQPSLGAVIRVPFVVTVAAALGWMFGFLALAFIGPAIYHFVLWINCRPYQAGDCVQVLAGPHRGRVARIYEIWEERGQYRVELGEQAARDIEDVVSFLDIYWATAPQATANV